MVVLKTARELETMRQAGRIASAALALAGRLLRDGVSTADVDAEVKAFILAQGAQPTFLGYNGYPATTNISINREVIHGIPRTDVLVKTGDIVSVDVGATFRGYVGDNAATFAIGPVSEEARRLMEVTREALARGIAAAVEGNRIGDISYAVQSCAEASGFSVVRAFVGHGVGRKLHEEPEVPNFGRPGHGLRLVNGMTLAIEPMICQGGYEVEILDDGWTVVTRDGGLAAHFENTILVSGNRPVILTSH